MRFGYYDRLSPARKRIYRRSDDDRRRSACRPAWIWARPSCASKPRCAPTTARRCSASARAFIDALVAGYHVPGVRVRVLAARPADDYGELHGLYEPEDGRALPRLTAWMRTAQRRQVVAFKTFLRTVIHELCHHLDYELFALEETFHTEGFYKRESSLVSALLAQRQARDRAVAAA